MQGTIEKKPPLKIGLIADAVEIPWHYYEIINWATNQQDITISHLIIQRRLQTLPGNCNLMGAYQHRFRHSCIKGLEGLLWSKILNYELKRIKNKAFSNYATNKNVENLIEHKIFVDPVSSDNGLFYRFSDSDMAKIDVADLDLIILCVPVILQGNILSSAKLGIISIHHADNRKIRGGPPGFWEVYLKIPDSGFVIQQPVENPDISHVLLRGSFLTAATYIANQVNVRARSNHYLKMLLKNIAATRKLPDIEQGVPYCNALYQNPPLKIQIHYLTRILYRSLSKKIRNRMPKKSERWQVAFQKTDWRNLAMYKSCKISNPKGRFFADPFVISQQKKDFCFVEDYDYSTKRGGISVLELKDNDAKFLGRAISEPFHMSFPFLFEYDGSLYMMPETSRKKQIRVYECTYFPLKWELKSILMDDVSATDTMIFEKNGLWWMLSNINSDDGPDRCSELSIFYSTCPLSNEWVSHPCNPIIVDPLRARNGGILFDGDKVFRVSQKQGYLQFGIESNIYQITEISQYCYKESFTGKIEPSFFKGLIGTHHLHSNGNVTVFDFAKIETIEC